MAGRAALVFNSRTLAFSIWLMGIIMSDLHSCGRADHSALTRAHWHPCHVVRARLRYGQVYREHCVGAAAAPRRRSNRRERARAKHGRSNRSPTWAEPRVLPEAAG